MKLSSVLVIGGGIGGLTAAIALTRKGFPVEIIERDLDWTVYGVGIIQQFNAVRAMGSLGLLDAYMAQAYGFDVTEIYSPEGEMIAKFPTPRLAGEKYPSNAGIRRSDLQRVLATRAQELGIKVRLGVTAETLADNGSGVDVRFSDGRSARYDIVIGADGVFSRTRTQIFPDAPKPRYTGQWVWRYNFPQSAELDCIRVYTGPHSAGVVPLGQGLMYMFLLSEETPDFRLSTEGAAAIMRSRSEGTAPQIVELAQQITDDAAVVGRPLEVVFLEGDWHRSRIVLLGDAVHASTPHLAQGAGMAIEDSIVLADELDRADDPESAFRAYRMRRYDRVKFIFENSVRLGESQTGRIGKVEMSDVQRQALPLMARPI